MCSLANSEDPECGISSGSTLYAMTKESSAQEMHFYVEIITCDPSVYTMDHPKFIASNQKEESSRALRAKCLAKAQLSMGCTYSNS